VSTTAPHRPLLRIRDAARELNVSEKRSPPDRQGRASGAEGRQPGSGPIPTNWRPTPTEASGDDGELVPDADELGRGRLEELRNSQTAPDLLNYERRDPFDRRKDRWRVRPPGLCRLHRSGARPLGRWTRSPQRGAFEARRAGCRHEVGSSDLRQRRRCRGTGIRKQRCSRD
jgi:hypothetical protein